jgi:sporulation protein YhbH
LRAQKIKQDQSRFHQIVRGKIKHNLKRYMSNGELIGRKGKDKVSIPIPQIDIPRFRFGTKDTGGVGQGEGEEGDPIGQGKEKGQGGTGKAGSDPGEHSLEVEVSLEELAEIMGETLELPRIQPKGTAKLETSKERYTGIRRVGPESLRHFKHTYKQALKRMIASGLYNPDSPIVVPTREDKRYRSWVEKPIPYSNAVIIYMMDVSGSMGNEQKEIVRMESFWIDTWLRSQYRGIENRYIIHDATAREVDRDTFFHTRESGGTMISSAYKLCLELIEKEYSPANWNIYPFHFSDGDNWSAEDTKECMRVLREGIIPASNMFAYGQVESPYGSGQFIKDLRSIFPAEEKVVLSEIKNREAILQSIKDFLGRGM